MKTRLLHFGWLICALGSAPAAPPLTESTFTEIIKEAAVVAAATKNTTPARTNEVFRVPDLVRTGPESRVEMTAPDKTITRIGANTVFTFEAAERTIRLERGSLLFHAPAGQGGGAIKHRGTTAAVVGTTLICAVLADGSFKTLVLEGQAIVTLAAGRQIKLKAGESVVVSPDGNDLGAAQVFNLGRLVSRLLLVMGFSQPLSSMPLIAAAIQLQSEQIATGTLDHFISWRVAGTGLDLIPGYPEPLDSANPFLLDHTLQYVSPSIP